MKANIRTLAETLVETREHIDRRDFVGGYVVAQRACFVEPQVFARELPFDPRRVCAKKQDSPAWIKIGHRILLRCQSSRTRAPAPSARSAQGASRDATSVLTLEF